MDKSQTSSIDDYICIGLGPFNLSFACMADSISQLRGRVLEQSSEFNWHPGILIEGTTLQNPFLADLVSMADPTSPLSYLNYCKQQGRLYQLYIRENFYPNRSDYNQYCRWAVDQLDNIQFNHQVTDIHYDESKKHYVVAGIHNDDGEPKEFSYRGKALIIGVGSLPQFPSSVAEECKRLSSQLTDKDKATLIHSGQYLSFKEQLQQCQEITVIGSGQSGAEVFYDLLKESEGHQYSLNWVTRSSRYFQMETAKLTLENITPDYAEYYFDLDLEAKSQILEDHKSLYKGINTKLINDIYDALDDNYHYRHCQVRLHPNLDLLDVDLQSEQQFSLHFKHSHTGEEYINNPDGVVFASGYKPEIPNFIKGINNRICWDAEGNYQLNKNWSVDINGNEIYVQNAGLQGHGITNPDIGMACYRNSRIINAITGTDYFPVEETTSFQQYQPSNSSTFKPVKSI